MARAAAAEHVQAGRLRRKTRAPAHGADDERGQRHRGVHTALTLGLVTRNAEGTLSYAGDILTAGEVERRQPIGDVALQPERAALRDARRGGHPVLPQLLGGSGERALDYFARQVHLGRHLLAAHVREAQRGGLLIARVVALHEEAARARRALCQDELAHAVGAERHHILAGSITAGVGEDERDVIALQPNVDVLELRVATRLPDDLIEARPVRRHPLQEVPGRRQVFKLKHRCPLHFLLDADAGDAPGLAGGLRAAVEARHERPLRRRERGVEVAARRGAVDEQRPDYPRRYLREPDEVLDVAAERFGVLDRLRRGEWAEVGSRVALDHIDAVLLPLGRPVVASEAFAKTGLVGVVASAEVYEPFGELGVGRRTGRWGGDFGGGHRDGAVRFWR